MEHIARGYYQAVAQGKITSPAALTASQLTEMANEYWQRTPLNNPIITDKMPHNFYHIGLITQIFPKAPIIYMNRDPRDVCLSIYCRLFPDVHRYAVDQEWLGHFYGISERLKRHWLTRFPNRILNVVYEDLIKNPTDKTKEIAAFCKLDWRPDCLDFHKHTTTSFTFSELQVRRPINRKGIGKWNKYKKELLPLINSLKKSGCI